MKKKKITILSLGVFLMLGSVDCMNMQKSQNFAKGNTSQSISTFQNKNNHASESHKEKTMQVLGYVMKAIFITVVSVGTGYSIYNYYSY